MRSGTYFDPNVIEAFVQYFSAEIEPRHRRLMLRRTLKEPQQPEEESSETRTTDEHEAQHVEESVC